MTGYMLVGAAVIVTSGALGDVLGRRRVFLAGLALFVGSCVLIALAGSGEGGPPAGRRAVRSGAVHRAAAAAATAHTIPTEPSRSA